MKTWCGFYPQQSASHHRPAFAEVGNAAQDSIGGMRVLVDNKALAAALPLAPQASASVPILLHACTVRPCELSASISDTDVDLTLLTHELPIRLHGVQDMQSDNLWRHRSL